MNKTTQVIILSTVMLLGIGARVSIFGYLITIGLPSVFIFGSIHLFIHSKYLNYFATGGIWVILGFILSHIFFLGIFLFQFDVWDTPALSVLGNLIGIDGEYLIENWVYFIGISLTGYIGVNAINIFNAVKINPHSDSSVKFVPAFIGSILLPLICIYFLYTFRYYQEDKEMESTGEFLSIERALNNPEKVTSIILNSTIPELSIFPIEILDLPNLRIIDLNEQSIDIIPDAISHVHSLEILNLLDNNINEIPESLCNCNNLTELRVGGEINGFPECLKKMKSLKHLTIQSNTANELMDELREFEYLETANFYLKSGNIDQEKLSQIRSETGIEHKN